MPRQPQTAQGPSGVRTNALKVTRKACELVSCSAKYSVVATLMTRIARILEAAATLFPAKRSVTRSMCSQVIVVEVLSRAVAGKGRDQ